jgi:hypothetical protein
VDYGQGLIGILGAIIGGGISLISARQAERFRQRDESRRLLVALFGELLNLERHCGVVLPQVSSSLGTRADAIQVRLWKHPPLNLLRDNIAQFGFLTGQDIRDLIRLSMTTRNDDIWVEAILEDLERSSLNDAEAALPVLKARFLWTQQSASKLLNSIASRNPKLAKLIQSEKP